MTRAEQFTRWCIFCRRPSKMTNEHVWGDWLKPYVDRIANKHVLHQRLVGRLGTQDRERTQIRAGGSPLHSKVPVVCVACNSGWLSRIQQRAKPYLLPLVEGRERILIGPRAQLAIATWATMATITAEFIHRRLASIAISNDAREAFRNAQHPLGNWRIWIGTYHRWRWDGCYVHACQPIYFEGQTVIPNVEEPNIPLPTTQWSTFIVGKLYVHVASSMTSPDLIQKRDWRNAPRARDRLVQVWPLKEGMIVWPTPALSDADAKWFSLAHWDQLHRENRVHPLQRAN
jgi:hypothetical protein